MEFDWSKLDNEVALKVKNFLNQQFKKILFPSYLKNVNIVSFDFGTITPVVNIENIEDPYPHFYEDSDTSHDESDEELVRDQGNSKQNRKDERDVDVMNDDFEIASTSSQPPPYAESGFPPLQMNTDITNLVTHNMSFSSHKFSKSNTTLNSFPPFFQSTFSGLSGNIVSASGLSIPHWIGPHLLNTYYPPLLKHEEQFSPLNQNIHITSSNISSSLSHTKNNLTEDVNVKESQSANFNEDFQIKLRIKYEGDIKIEITAELHLEYHSSVLLSLPVKITLTGLSFEATAILAYINKRFHFCFIDEEQKEKLLKSIKIESEIGDKNKQILKNVGKIEIFLLEQLRKIIERELLFPSWLTIII